MKLTHEKQHVMAASDENSWKSQNESINQLKILKKLPERMESSPQSVEDQFVKIPRAARRDRRSGSRICKFASAFLLEYFSFYLDVSRIDAIDESGQCS